MMLEIRRKGNKFKVKHSYKTDRECINAMAKEIIVTTSLLIQVTKELPEIVKSGDATKMAVLINVLKEWEENEIYR